ncbi:FAD-linked oxidase [Tumebacillus algifaecis]|uniref:FAD-linked oxidase n=1 Tax=Tumebacillus algifaecis TaxID=1214604 RepID=A0A223CXR2_9BACL|nr:FAD-binding oxidoreductase [Tumebacillus algifaecis]ASS73893.1 FAD-linked oxidase [Tumebacillus algifaecis]
MIKHKESLIAGWGNYPAEVCNVYRPDRVRDITELIASGAQPHYISRGLGRSYGDTALNHGSGVLLHTEFARFVHFDEQTGILECEAGVSFEEIIEHFLPRGWFLPVTPGTKFVTVGGAIANDVHGKNHHVDGTFSQHVLDFKLLLASGEIVHCSREEQSDLFYATIGGVGLTGVILTARFRLIPVESAYLEVDYLKAKNLDHAFELFAQTNEKYQYSVAWIDCLSKGDNLGRSVLMLGNHAPASKVKTGGDPLRIKNKPKFNVPFNFPSFVLNRWSIRAFNFAYYNIHQNEKSKIVDYDSFFYPLDSVHNWNRAYGKKGFVQYQAVFPPETSRQGLTEMLKRLSQSGRSSFLAVLKSSGEQNGGLLSFPFKGYTLALDIPLHDDGLFPFLRELDELVAAHGGRIYLAKDSEASPATFANMYPDLAKFQAVKAAVDPNNVFSSSQARRLGIVEESR